MIHINAYDRRYCTKEIQAVITSNYKLINRHCEGRLPGTSRNPPGSSLLLCADPLQAAYV